MKIWNHDQPFGEGLLLPVQFVSLVVMGLLAFPVSLQAQDAVSGPSPATSTASEDSTASVAASMNSMASLNDETKLNNGDRVSYRVTEEQKDPMLLTISDSGELEVPLVGRVAAAGKTCKQLAYAIKPLLEKEYFYHATVIVGLETLSTHSRGKVYLSGQVSRPGAIDIPPNETFTVSKAILLDGGLADFADKRKVKLVRKKPDGTTQTTVVDLVEILDKGRSNLDPVLQAEDVIVVPQRLINF